MEKEQDGVWRTIRGRRIFIRDGESLGSAMARSGKFKREDIREGKREAIIDEHNKNVNNLSKWKKTRKLRNKIYTPTQDNQAEKNRIHEDRDEYLPGKTRVERNYPKYSETDRREVEHEELQKRLFYERMDKNSGNDDWDGEAEVRKYAKETGKTYEQAEKELRRDYRKYEDEKEKRIADYKAKKQSNNKIVSDWENGAISDEEALKRFNGDKELATKTFESMGYKSPFKQSNNKEETERELYERAKNNPESIDPMTENSTDWEALEKKYGKQEETFIQNTNMYGGTREYSKEDLKRMEEAGIRPMKDSYTGGGWEGVNSHKNLSTSEQAKAITSEMKKQFPDVKIARKSDIYSGGSSIDFNIMSSDKDLFVNDKEIDKMEDFGNITSSYEWERWANANVKNYEKTHSYWDSDKRKYAKEVLNNLKKRDIQAVRGDEWFLSDYGKKVVSALNKEANSYTYSDNDGMVDYFNHGTYMHISIGKWDKPYQVNDVKAKVDAYKKRKGK